jgi:hypothetical protein
MPDLLAILLFFSAFAAASAYAQLCRRLIEPPPARQQGIES